MRYAQIVTGLKNHGKSTYCKALVEYAETKGKKIRVVNLDPYATTLLYSNPIADVRDVVNLEKIKKADDDAPGSGAGIGLTLAYISKGPGLKWLFQSIENVEADFILFDCPGEAEYNTNLTGFQLFAEILTNKDVHPSVIFVRDSNLNLNICGFLRSCFTLLAFSKNITIPHRGVMMKVDLLTPEHTGLLRQFINLDPKKVFDVYSTAAQHGHPCACKEMADIYRPVAKLLQGSFPDNKYYHILDIKENSTFVGLLAFLDKALEIPYSKNRWE